MSASCIYEGTIRHRRLEPRREFSHRLALVYLDLVELPGLLDGRLVARRPGLVRFDRRDYLGDPGVPLERAVRDLVQDRTGSRPTGPIRVLTHLRSFGHCFNPVSFYYCMDSDGERAQALRAGVTVFDATLALRRRQLTRASMARITARYPLATVRVLGLIYAHALGLKLAGVPVHRHPQTGSA